MANGISLYPGLPATNANFCVGQDIGFVLEFNPALPARTQTGPCQWSFAGTFINDIVPPRYSDGSTNYNLNSDLLTNATPHAWWTEGDYSPPATYWAKIGEGLAFPNGQDLAVAQKGLFTMHQPEAGELHHTAN